MYNRFRALRTVLKWWEISRAKYNQSITLERGLYKIKLKWKSLTSNIWFALNLNILRFYSDWTDWSICSKHTYSKSCIRQYKHLINLIEWRRFLISIDKNKYFIQFATRIWKWAQIRRLCIMYKISSISVDGCMHGRKTIVSPMWPHRPMLLEHALDGTLNTGNILFVFFVHIFKVNLMFNETFYDFWVHERSIRRHEWNAFTKKKKEGKFGASPSASDSHYVRYGTWNEYIRCSCVYYRL